jgi:hypothetical protein
MGKGVMNTDFRLSRLFFYGDSDRNSLHCDDVGSDVNVTHSLHPRRRSRVAECSCIVS